MSDDNEQEVEGGTRPWTVGMREKQDAIAAQVAEAKRAEIDDTMARIRATAERLEAERKMLPCYGKPDAEAVAACESVAAHEQCRWGRDVSFGKPSGDCPRRLAIWNENQAKLAEEEERRQFRQRLELVPLREREILRAGRDKSPPLKNTAALAAVREWLAASPRPALLMLAGPTGIGKTVAACYAIAKLGGMYARSYALTRPGFDIDAAQAAEVLVLDQSGREHVGPSAFGMAALEEIIDGRYASRLPTILVCNLTREQWESRYDDIIAERMRGDGQWVQLDGDSLRGAK